MPQVKRAVDVPDATPPGGAYFTPAEVADRYRVSLSAVRQWRLRGDGPRGISTGGRVLYPVAEIERYDRELARQLARDGAAI